MRKMVKHHRNPKSPFASALFGFALLVLLQASNALQMTTLNVNQGLQFTVYSVYGAQLLPSLPGSADPRIIFTSRGSSNTLNIFYPANGTVQRVMGGPVFSSGCVPNVTSNRLNSSSPIQPQGFTLTNTWNSVLLSDRAPGNRILNITTGDGTFSPSTLLTPTPIVGSACNYTAASYRNNTSTIQLPVESSTIRFFEGCVYFNQANSVGYVNLSTGVYYDFFGSETTPGSFNDTFNMKTVPVWNATTSGPSDFFIDEKNRVMYVAEMNFNTVRRIDLGAANGSSSVRLASMAVGYFNSPVPFGANCTDDTPCWSNRTSLVNPTAVAVYNARSVRETWLFVADLTVSLYKVIVETGKVVLIAGTPFLGGETHFGTFPGTTVQLGWVRQLSVSPNSLIVADRKLRVIDLEDPAYDPQPPAPTSAPPVLPQTVVTGTQTTIVVSTLVVAVVNPSMGVQVTRASLLLNLVLCESNIGSPLAIFDSLLQMSVGSTDYRYAAGAIVGNIILIIAFGAAVVLLGFVMALVQGKALSKTLATLHFPSVLLIPIFFVLQSTTSSSFTLLLYVTQSAGLIILGIIGVLVSVVILFTASYFTFFKFSFTYYTLEEEREIERLAHKRDHQPLENNSSLQSNGSFALAPVIKLRKLVRDNSFIMRWTSPEGEWYDNMGDDDELRRFGYLFEDYRADRWWYGVIEVGMCVAGGLLDASHPTQFVTCSALVSTTAGVYIVYFLSIVLLRPFRIKINFVISAAIAGLQAAGALFMIPATFKSSKDWATTSSSFVLASLYVSVLRTVYDIVCIISIVVTQLIIAGKKKRLEADAIVVSSGGGGADRENGDRYLMQRELSNQSMISLDMGGGAYVPPGNGSILNTSFHGMERKTPTNNNSDPLGRRLSPHLGAATDAKTQQELLHHEKLRIQLRTMLETEQRDREGTDDSAFIIDDILAAAAPPPPARVDDNEAAAPHSATSSTSDDSAML